MENAAIRSRKIEAMNLLAKSLFKKPNAKPFIEAGDAARDAQNWLRAAEAYGEALKLKPERADIWVQLGHARKEAGDLVGAEQAYRQALKLEPRVYETHVQMGHLRRLEKRLPEAAAHYLDAAEIDPSQRYPLEALMELTSQGVEVDTERAGRLAKRWGSSLTTGSDHASISAQLDAAIARLEPSLRAENSASIQALAESIRSIEAKLGQRGDDPKRVSDGLQIVFDVSDLVGFFNVARLPTGIQRVQIEVISNLLAREGGGSNVAVCTFSKDRDLWSEVPADIFLRLCQLSLESGDLADETWSNAVKSLRAITELSPEFQFQEGACLVNLGTSWWLQNYFLHVRRAKELYGVRYVPFVHDMIPIMTPEHCVKELTQDFISWALGVFSHADHFLTNSEASKRDLLTVAEQLGHTIAPQNIHVVRLNADFRKPTISVPIAQTLSRYGLVEQQYVLFVSTVESRKNHLSAFKAWQDLIRRRGAGDVLKLICVGNRGWLNDAVFSKLEADKDLQSKVMIVSGVSDPDLANLYKASAFTLYPSTYEGWGLPVTESFCYGKAALLSDSSSLPEAGGNFADYFRVGDQAEFLQKLERLMFDLPYRREREQNILSNFQPRPWRELGEDVEQQLLSWFPAGERDALPASHVPTLGRYYPLNRTEALAIHRTMESGERFRSGTGWWFPDDWGNWTKPEGGMLKLRFEPASIGEPKRLYVRLLGLSARSQPYRIALGGVKAEEGVLAPQQNLWCVVNVPIDAQASGELVVGLHGGEYDDFAAITDGRDTRKGGLGVFGFMICDADDLLSRANLMEAIALGGGRLPGLDSQ